MAENATSVINHVKYFNTNASAVSAALENASGAMQAKATKKIRAAPEISSTYQLTIFSIFLFLYIAIPLLLKKQRQSCLCFLNLYPQPVAFRNIRFNDG